MKLYINDQSDSQYMETLKSWQKSHESTTESMAREIKKIERINKAQRTKHKKKSLFSRIIGAFKFKS